MKLPGLHELQAFDAAARLASFAKAAKELHVTESAISHRIRSLEDDLGASLFVRGYRSVALTEAGEAYRGSIRDAFDALAEAHRRVDALRNPCVNVAVPTALGARTLGPLFAQFHLEHPGVQLRIVPVDPKVPPLSSKTDVAILYGDHALPGFKTVAEIAQGCRAVSSPGYLTALGIRDPQGMRRAALLQHPALSWREWFRSAGAVAPDSASTGPVYEDATMMLESAACGLGVALCPELAVSPWLRGGQLSTCFDVRMAAPPYVIHRADRCADEESAGDLARWLAVRLSEIVAPPTRGEESEAMAGAGR